MRQIGFRFLLACIAAILTAQSAHAGAELRQVQAAGSVDLAVVVSLDRSESIDREEARAQITGLAFALRHPRYIQAITSGYYKRIALATVTWSSFGRHHTIMPWRIIETPQQAEAAAKHLERYLDQTYAARHGTQTDVGFGIEIAVQQIQTLPWKATDRVINVVADGISNIGRIASIDRDLAISAGININGLIMGQHAAIAVMSRYFKREVIAGPGAFIQVSHTNEDFADAMLRKLIREMVELRRPHASLRKPAG